MCCFGCFVLYKGLQEEGLLAEDVLLRKEEMYLGRTFVSYHYFIWLIVMFRNKDFMPELDASKSFLMRLQGRDSNYMIKFEHHDEAESFHYYLQKYYRQEDEVKSEVMQHEIVEKLVFEVPDNLFSQHHISDETLQLIKGTGFDPSSMKVEEIIFARDFIEKFMLSLKKQPILSRCSAHSTRIPIAPNVVPNFRKVPIPPVLSPSNNETLLQQLQRGTTLRHVENHLLPENEVKRQENSTVETIADALAKALEARRHQIERADSVENVAETQDWD
uniref:RGS domain-containing protein n=1 Tax=Rhabditophanes sp. KR3021 TaxID=114890 RepID=A0AC35TSH3_9BILA